jgi:two-component system, NarL family, nitrate/nitrite response regulator NarL
MEGEGPGIRVLVAHSQSLFCDAVRSVFERETDLRVVGMARDGVQAIGEAQRIRPHVALVDLNLPNCDGIRVTRTVTERDADCSVVVIADEEDETTLLGSVEAGARGYVTQNSPLEDLIEATRAIHRGEVLIPKAMLAGLISRLVGRGREKDEALRRMACLTPREKEVLALVAEGSDKDEIARLLVISPQTARTHIQNLLRKLEVHSRLEAAAFAMRNGILEELSASRMIR